MKIHLDVNNVIVNEAKEESEEEKYQDQIPNPEKETCP